MPQEKTRKKNDDVPIFPHEDCPGNVIRYFNKQRAADKLALREIIHDELQPLLEHKKILSNHTIWLILLTLADLFELIAIIILFSYL